MNNKNDILISVDETHMKNKQYNPQVSLVTYIKGYITSDKDLTIGKKELKLGLKELTQLSDYKINTIIKAYLQLGLMTEKDDLYVLSKVDAPFIGLKGETVRFCLTYTSDFVFKIYIYLLNKYEINKLGREQGRFVENYFFAKKYIAQALGYNPTKEANILKVNEGLEILKDLGLINYGPSKKREGHNGYYHELYWVNKYSITQIEAQKKYLQQRQQQGKHKVGESTKKNLIDPFRQEIENNNNSLNGIDFEKSVKKLESAQEVIYIDRQLSNGSKTIKTPQSRLDQINRELEEINGRKS